VTPTSTPLTTRLRRLTNVGAAQATDRAPIVSLRSEDRRAHRRLPLTLYLEVRSVTESGRLVEMGVTADVSAGGLAFSSFNWRQLAPGTPCLVTVCLPFESVLFTDRRRLTAPATVVRWIDEESVVRHGAPAARRGVAVRFNEPLTFAASA
jgi:hypothetical protein